jgi:hypothetical protein
VSAQTRVALVGDPYCDWDARAALSRSLIGGCV